MGGKTVRSAPGPQAHQRLWTIRLGTGSSCFADQIISISETIFLVRECPLQTVSDRTIGHATCAVTVASSSQAKSGSQLNYGRSRYACKQRKAVRAWQPCQPSRRSARPAGPSSALVTRLRTRLTSPGAEICLALARNAGGWAEYPMAYSALSGGCEGHRVLRHHHEPPPGAD